MSGGLGCNRNEPFGRTFVLGTGLCARGRYGAGKIRRCSDPTAYRPFGGARQGLDKKSRKQPHAK